MVREPQLTIRRPREAGRVGELHRRHERRPGRRARGHLCRVVDGAVGASGGADGAQRVHASRAEARVESGRAKIVGGRLDTCGELCGGEGRVLAQDQRRQTGDERGGLRGAAQDAVAPALPARRLVGRVARRRADDPVARSRHADVQALTREDGVRVARGRRRDGEHAGIGGRVLDLVHRVAARTHDTTVPRRRDDEETFVLGVAHGAAQREAVIARAERDVHDARAVVGHVHDRRADIRDRAGAGAVERLDRKDLHPKRDAADPRPVVRTRGDDSRDMRSV